VYHDKQSSGFNRDSSSTTVESTVTGDRIEAHSASTTNVIATFDGETSTTWHNTMKVFFGLR
jgi:hypothetical protein